MDTEISRDGRYDHATHGAVRVVDLRRHIDSVTPEGDVTATTLVVEFASDSGGIGGAAIAVGSNLHTEPLPEFVAAVAAD